MTLKIGGVQFQVLVMYSTAYPYIIVVGHQVRHDEYWRKSAGKINCQTVLAFSG